MPTKNSNLLQDKRKVKNEEFPEKVFTTRNSLIIDLLQNDHIKTIYHVFLATFIGIFIHTVAHDYFRKTEFTLGLNLISIAFKKWYWSVLGWIGFFLMTCSTYFLFKIWAKTRTKFSKLSLQAKWDKLWLTLLIVYYLNSFYLATIFVNYFEVNPASAALVVIDQIRLLMKVHAFVRVNAENVLKYKPKDSKLVFPKLSHFIYFLFAPTLIYRDTYPRTSQINWKFTIARLLEIITMVFFSSLILERFLLPTVQDFGLRKFSVSEIVLIILENTIIGFTFMIPMFFITLHSLQNFFAEILRFGDRMFYKDWWTATSLSGYFRTWNVVVHDWLYTYIYVDMCKNVTNNNRALAKFAVFFVSAIVHEWALTYVFGFFFPLLFVEFFFGILLNFVKPPKMAILNILFLYSLGLGFSCLLSLYAIEHLARIRLPIQNPTIMDFFVPRFLTCNCIDY